MNVLENLRNLGTEAVRENLEAFKIKSTGDFEQDIVNLKNFYFENLETLYNNLPLETYEFLEIALGDYCEEDYRKEFEDILYVFEDLGLSNTTVSNLVDKKVFILNKYILETNNYPPFSGKIAEEFKNTLIENGINPEEKIGEKTFSTVDKEIGTALFNFLKENKEIRENEKFNLNLLDKILKVHNYLTMDETFKIFNELKINCDLNKLTTLIYSKFYYIYEEDNTVLLFRKNNCKKFLSGDPIKYMPLTEIYSLETYLQA